MIKYIKTKDNRIIKIDLENNEVFTSKYEVVGEPKNTIEELCDVFHLKLGDFVYHKFLTLNNAIKWVKENEDVMERIYGAIWTDEGLIYVAKMNDEGELELI